MVIEVRAEDRDLLEEGGKQQQHRQIDITRFAFESMIIIFYSRYDNIQFCHRTRREAQIRDQQQNRIDPNDPSLRQGRAWSWKRGIFDSFGYGQW